MTTKTYPTKEAIRLTKFWQEHGPNTYPLDIGKLIDGTINDSTFPDKLTTQYDKFDSFEGSLVRRTNTNNWVILLNQKIKNERRLRFTYAHELGHFMCHRYLCDCFEDSAETLNDFEDNIEIEANVFASWLLIPANRLRDEFRKSSWNIETLRKVGTRFECSLQATGYRYVDFFKIKPVAFVVSRDGRILWTKKSDSAPYMKAYCIGDDLPEKSDAKACESDIEVSGLEQEWAYSWSDTRRSKESHYFDRSGMGYQYTCIEFEE